MVPRARGLATQSRPVSRPTGRIGRALRAAAMPLLLAGCTWTRPFTDDAGHIVPGSVAVMQRFEIGGIPQAVWFRGRSTAAPVLILLHGGPGVSETGLFRHFDAALEDSFLVVYWDQRGAGRSYRRGLARDSMTIDRMTRDLDALVDTVRTRFGTERVALLGHSWGTILGTRYAHAHPEKISVYVGVAQIADFAEGERLSYRWAIEQAEARGDARALRALGAMAPAPRSVEDELELGRWVERFGGMRRGGLSTGRLIWAALRSDEVGLVDLYRFGAGNRWSLRALRPQYSREDLTRLRDFEVPIVFLLGRHDWHVPAVLAADYFEQIYAPCKQLVWFEQAAHDPPFEQPETFVRTMFRVVLPLARHGCLAASDSGGGHPA